MAENLDYDLVKLRKEKESQKKRGQQETGKDK